MKGRGNPIANLIVLGSDDQADVQAAGIGERTEDVVEKWPPKRDHRLDARIGDL